MPKITKGGVSNRLVDPDFIAEPGTPVEVAVEEGRPDVGGQSEEQPETHQGRALYAEDDETTDNEQDKPVDDETAQTDKNPQAKPQNSGDTPAAKARPRKATPPK